MELRDKSKKQLEKIRGRLEKEHPDSAKLGYVKHLLKKEK